MKLSKSLKVYLDEAKKSDSYWVEKAKLDFSVALNNQRNYAKITYAEMAKRIVSSPAYISKVFRGDSNLTIESMVKLALATGGQVEIRIVDSATAINTWDLTHYMTIKTPAIVPSNSITSVRTDAANHPNFSFELAYA